MDNYIPKCFDKVYSKVILSLKQSSKGEAKHPQLIKGRGSSQIFEISSKKSLKYFSSAISDLPPGLILDELKKWTNFNQWFPWINRITPLTKWNDYCEMIEMSFNIPYLSWLGFKRSYKLIFFWSFSSEDKCYYMLYKPIDSSLHLMKYGAFIINVTPGLEIKNNILSTTCIISAYIKFKKYPFSSFSLFDRISYSYGVELCSSMDNFYGLVEMNKHFSKTKEESQLDRSVNEYQYVISFLNNEKVIKPKTRKLSYDNQFTKSSLISINPKVTCSIDEKNLCLLKAFLEVKNSVKELFNCGYYKDKDLVRFVVAYQGKVDLIISVLEDFAHFRKNSCQYSESIPYTQRRDYYSNEIIYLMKDLLNRPVIQVNVGTLLQNKLFDYKSFYVFLMLLLDDVFERIDQGVDKIVLIMNLHNFSIENISKMRLNQLLNEFDELIKLLMRFYVERLGEAYLINLNDSFRSLWNVAQRSLNQNLQSKIVLCHNIRQDLSSILTNEQINELLI